MKKQAFENGEAKDSPEVDEFVGELERTTSLIDFYKLKDRIIENLRRAKK